MVVLFAVRFASCCLRGNRRNTCDSTLSWFRSQWIGNALLAYAPAKLNLTLRVLGKREDGYHDLRSLVVAVDLVDTLVFRPGRVRGIELEVNVPELRTSENLVVRALELVRDFSGAACENAAVRVYVHKRIPHGAGLGGGSSDASCALRAGRDWLAARISDVELFELSARLGSDCPFFARRVPAAVVEGRGEIVRPVALGTELHFVVVWPRVHLSTQRVFQACSARSDNNDCESRLIDALQGGVFDMRLQPLLRNDLLEAAAKLCPAIREIVDMFHCAGVPATMSGSGSAVFGVLSDRERAVAIARRIRQQVTHFVTTVRSLE